MSSWSFASRCVFRCVQLAVIKLRNSLDLLAGTHFLRWCDCTGYSEVYSLIATCTRAWWQFLGPRHLNQLLHFESTASPKRIL